MVCLVVFDALLLNQIYSAAAGPTAFALAQTFEKYYENTDYVGISRKFMMAALRLELASKDFTVKEIHR